MNDNYPMMSLRDVIKFTSLSKGFILAACREGEFPQPVKLGVRRIGFVRAEVQKWLDDRIAARSGRAFSDAPAKR